MSLMEMMARAAAAERGEEDRVKILPEAQVMILREALDNYNKPVPFAVGDLVTPRKNSNVRGTGNPHVVLEINPDAKANWVGEPTSSSFGRRSSCAWPPSRRMALSHCGGARRSNSSPTSKPPDRGHMK